MKKIIIAILRAILTLYIANFFTNDYFSYNIFNLLVLSILSFPGLIIIYLLSII